MGARSKKSPWTISSSLGWLEAQGPAVDGQDAVHLGAVEAFQEDRLADHAGGAGDDDLDAHAECSCLVLDFPVFSRLLPSIAAAAGSVRTPGGEGIGGRPRQAGGVRRMRAGISWTSRSRMDTGVALKAR